MRYRDSFEAKMHNIVWFRSDLRTLDNSALSAALNSKSKLPVRAVFCITEKQWLSHDWGANKIGFVLQSLIALQQQLQELNISLDILNCDDFKSTPQALLKYLQQHQAKNIFFSCEYELNERQRDLEVEETLAANKIGTHKFHSQTLIPPGAILTKQNTPYTVFTPFKKACYAHLFNDIPKLLPKLKPQSGEFKLATFDLKNNKYLSNPILKQWPAGQVVALKLLRQFCDEDIRQYKNQRDFPALHGTSTLSPHLAVGSLSVRQCLVAALNANEHQLTGGNPNITCWIDELWWRDFYKQIMWHFPDLCKGKNFNTKYDTLRWQDPDNNLVLWQQGRTGVPIIDAAMRQLVSTGWMHNRLRMVVAMFLTKNLLIDWRHGERFFSEHLIDLDFASNNGGWQWSASTGTDAVPYFRVFNPISQSLKFDANGEFIKKFCPELKSLDHKQIHDPSAILSNTELAKLNYPSIIVNLSQSRSRAIERFKNIKSVL
jgi:deoxyribodipyrimidine photo-lyase